MTVLHPYIVGIAGGSGAGKTTVTYLLPRLYDPTGGKICLDGHDLRDLTSESLANAIGMVTQETYLFNDTLRPNVPPVIDPESQFTIDENLPEGTSIGFVTASDLDRQQLTFEILDGAAVILGHAASHPATHQGLGGQFVIGEAIDQVVEGTASGATNFLYGRTFITLQSMQRAVEVDVSGSGKVKTPFFLPNIDYDFSAKAKVRFQARRAVVVDSEGRFLGLIPPHRMLRVLLEEHSEDLARIGGFLHGSRRARHAAEERVGLRIWHRLPWLLIGLLGAMGFRKSAIGKVFLLEGLCVAVIGGLWTALHYPLAFIFFMILFILVAIWIIPATPKRPGTANVTTDDLVRISNMTWIAIGH